MLDVGDEAPDFELRDQHGQSVSLSRFRGRKHVLLVFYPAVFSNVCSSELSNLRDWWPQEGRDDAELVAISCDPMFALRGYSDAEGIEYPLLSDFWPHGEVARAYGVFDDSSGTPRRSSYLVDADGRVAWAVHNARPDRRPIEAYEAALAELP